MLIGQVKSAKIHRRIDRHQALVRLFSARIGTQAESFAIDQ